MISDWEGINQHHRRPPTSANRDSRSRTGVNAGIDMIMEPNNYQDFETSADPARSRPGDVPMSRIDDAVSRILDQEVRARPVRASVHRTAPTSARSARRRTGPSPAARWPKSQVLLKNKHRTLPLSKRDDVYVAGSNADNIGNQAGGWTLTWQGGSKNVIPGDDDPRRDPRRRRAAT